MMKTLLKKRKGQLESHNNKLYFVYSVKRDGKDVGSKALSVFEDVRVELNQLSTYTPKSLDYPVWADLVEDNDGTITAITIDPIANSSTWDIAKGITNPDEMWKAYQYLEVQLKKRRQPATWDELRSMWHDDLHHKLSFLDWLEENWNVPTPRSL